MKKIIVTGAGGFIGSHLTEFLVEKGFNVIAFVRYNSKNSWGWLENSEYLNEIEIINGDLRDYDSLKKAMKKCDTIFHLGALISIPYSYISPLAYIKTNIVGTYNVLEIAKEYSYSNIIITSTSETYGTAQYIPIDEQHPLVGQSPYSASKIAADQLAISYNRSFSLPIKIAKPFNTYGPRQSERAIIPTIITQLLCKSKTVNIGNINPSRDLNYVLDTVEGFYAIAKSDLTIGNIVNIGSNEEIKIIDLIYLIGELLHTKPNINFDNKRIRPVDSEVERLVCNNSKIKTLTEWEPRYKLKDGLLLTINWIKNNLDNFKNTYTI